MTMGEALYRKYRPSSFRDVTGQEHVKSSLLNQVASGTVAHAYLFTGPRGIGKTTVARLLAKAVNCLNQKGGEPCNACEACIDIMGGSSLDVAEIDAASQTGVENVRENIIESVRFAPNRLKYRVYIIDEVHMLSASSFNALLKTLEEPPAHAVFILATTEIHKVPATVISRCQRFDFRRMSSDVIVERLKGLAKEEGAKVDVEVLAEIARHADGGLRDAEGMLGQVLALGEKHVTMEIASLVIPATNRAAVDEFIASLLAQDAGTAITVLNRAVEQGTDLPSFSEDVISSLRDRILDLASPSPSNAKLQGKKLSINELTVSDLVPLIEVFLEARRQMKGARIVQLPLELAVIKACSVKPSPKVEAGGPALVYSHVADPHVADPLLNLPLSKGEGTLQPQTSTHDEHKPPSSPLLGKERVKGEVNAATEDESSIAPVTTALGDVPVLSLDDVKRRWPEVFEQIKVCNATLPMLMQTGELSGVDGDAVEIGFAYPLYVDAINQDKNRKPLEQVFARIFGRPVRVKAKHVKKEVEQVVDQLLDAFGGNVV